MPDIVDIVVVLILIVVFVATVRAYIRQRRHDLHHDLVRPSNLPRPPSEPE